MAPTGVKSMNHMLKIATLLTGAALMTQSVRAAPAVANDPNLDPQVRSFLVQIDQDPSPFWELPQPKPQEILTGLQNQTPVDMSGVTTVQKTVTQNGRQVTLYIMQPDHVTGRPGVLLFIHGGVWIVGNFQNHRRLLRDLVIGSGQVGVFVDIPRWRRPNFRLSSTNPMPPSNGSLPMLARRRRR
jgi:acetyl esterase